MTIEAPEEEAAGKQATPRGTPSNDVYNRVGDEIKLAAHAGVRRGLSAQDIVKEIASEHGVHLNVGELRLLLAGRRVSKE